jgi:ubiquinone biosynthesis protein
MARLLAYLFEVTERFGMETRTELILLQRTMVVVEGVARSLDPKINIWEVAHPVVEDYIKKSIGPRAVATDLMKTAKIMSRFGPRLPTLKEKILNAQAQTPTSDQKRQPWIGVALGAGAGILLTLLATHLL